MLMVIILLISVRVYLTIDWQNILYFFSNTYNIVGFNKDSKIYLENSIGFSKKRLLQYTEILQHIA